MKRLIGKSTKLAALCAIALPLAGCFNNMSGLDDDAASGSGSKSSALLNDSGFANETGPIDTNAVLVGTYKDSSGNGYGILIDLQKSLIATLGQDSVTTILTTIDTSTSMQARQVTVHIPSFGIKATTTLGKIAAGNNGKMRNIMNIRPRLVRVDLTSSALDVPASPHVLQLNNANKTVITYGGMIEGDYIRRMTVLIPFAGVNAGFLPSAAVPTYGDGFPAASPVESAGSVRLVPVTSEIANHFASLFVNLPYGSSIANSVTSDAIRAVAQTYNSLALAIHLAMNADGTAPTNCPVLTSANKGSVQAGCNLDGTRRITAAYFININPANNSGPETFTYCHSGYDQQEIPAPAGLDANQNPRYEVDYIQPLACNCALYAPDEGGCAAKAIDLSNPGAGAQPLPASITSSVFTDPWPAATANQNPSLLMKAITDAEVQPAPAAGDLSAGLPRVINDFTLTKEN